MQSLLSNGISLRLFPQQYVNRRPDGAGLRMMWIPLANFGNRIGSFRKLFPVDLLVGQLVESREGRYQVRLAADFERLAFLRVLRSAPTEEITEFGDVIILDETAGSDG